MVQHSVGRPANSRTALRLLALGVLTASVGFAAVATHTHFLHLRSTARAGKQEDGTTLVVTQQILKPWTHERFIKGRPVDLAFSSDRLHLAVLNMASIELFNEKTGDQQTIKTGTTSYCGIAFRPGDHEIWASDGTRREASIFITKLNEAGVADAGHRIRLPNKDLPAGIAFSADGDTAYVAMNGKNVVAIIDANTLQITREIPVGLAPLFVKLSADGNTLYVSNRGGHAPTKSAFVGFSSGVAMATDQHTGAVLDGTISIVDLKSGNVREQTVGRAPTSLALSPDGKALAVANSYSDSITLMDTGTLATKTVFIPTIPDHLLGTVPTSVIFSPDGRWLYVAAALNNAVIVLQHQGDSYKVAGAFPTGWFPVSLGFDSHSELAVLNLKGRGNTDKGLGDDSHNSRSFEGSLMRVPVLTPEQLKSATQFVIEANSPHFDSVGGVTDLSTLGIQHVILIVKENRTYDQVFGDIAKGNGDPKFVMFGRDITPNQHALAEKYVLLDNFYATGAISFDGHQWLEQGFVGDNVERAMDGPRGYAWNLSDALDVSPAGFIWQHSQRPLDVRVGGVLSIVTQIDPATQTQTDMNDSTFNWALGWKLWKQGKWQGRFGGRAAVPALASVMDNRYPANFIPLTDQIRAAVFEQEIAEADKSGHLPDLMIFGLPADHTMGTRPNNPTPSAMVADNDFAVGRMVSAVSKSRFWPNTLIFIVEDDAQNGQDHVDGHRTVALAVGPMVKRDTVDSNFYTQLSMARTIQDILRIDPQTHFLKAARAMNSIFTPQRDLSTYTPVTPKIALDTMNPPIKALSGHARKDAIASSKMNWSEIDDVPSAKLNRILWAAEKGYSTPMPASGHSMPPNAH